MVGRRKEARKNRPSTGPACGRVRAVELADADHHHSLRRRRVYNTWQQSVGSEAVFGSMSFYPVFVFFCSDFLAFFSDIAPFGRG